MVVLIYKFLRFLYHYYLKIYYLIFREIYEIFKSESSRKKNLIKTYEIVNLGHKRDNHIEVLNKTLRSLNMGEYGEHKGMFSEHLVIFAAISQLENYPKNILELGTYDGKTSAILSRLFPDSLITTIDLKDDDPIFEGSYKRKSSKFDFIKKRNKIIEKFDNIKFIQCNSLEIFNFSNFQKQDLIWVDGDHKYPVVTADITNAISLLSKSGILMCDDVLKQNNIFEQTVGTFETLKAYENAHIIKTELFKKRISKKYNLSKKYVSFSKIIID